MIRAVLDTNIIISGLFWQGPPRLVLRAGISQTFTLLLSPSLIAELQDVVSRDKFSNIRAALGKTAAEILFELQNIAEKVTDADIPPDAVRDRDDLSILACAIGGKAGYIVTGDHDLLTLETYQKVSIVTPPRFLEILNAQPEE